jgi:hypothetical protein
VGRPWSAQCTGHDTGRLHSRDPLDAAGPYTSMLPLIRHSGQRKKGKCRVRVSEWSHRKAAGGIPEAAREPSPVYPAGRVSE